jgi:hypothetical protein
MTKFGELNSKDDLAPLVKDALPNKLKTIADSLDDFIGLPGPQGPAGTNGKDGYTPIKNVDYFDGTPGERGDPGKDSIIPGPAGKDGYTPIKDVDYFDGKDGVNGIDGKDGATGRPGADGYTPVKGVDYFDGAQGPKGDTGADSIVPGPKGDTGLQGLPGVDADPPVYAILPSGTLAMGFATNTCVKITPSATQTFTTTVPEAGKPRTLMILTSGTASRTITFGAGFKPTGTLATGTTSARVFVIHWISDGVNLYEAGRTAAMVA